MSWASDNDGGGVGREGYVTALVLCVMTACYHVAILYSSLVMLPLLSVGREVLLTNRTV